MFLLNQYLCERHFWRKALKPPRGPDLSEGGGVRDTARIVSQEANFIQFVVRDNAEVLYYVGIFAYTAPHSVSGILGFLCLVSGVLSCPVGFSFSHTPRSQGMDKKSAARRYGRTTAKSVF